MAAGEDIVRAAVQSLRLCSGQDPEPAAVVNLLVANQVPLLSLSREPESDAVRDVLDSPAFDRAVTREQQVYSEVHANFAKAARAWEARGVRSLCFKSAGIVPSFPYTSENFDILFRPLDEPVAAEVLTDLGYVLLANCDEPDKWLYRLFVGGRSVSAIHVHTKVGWGQGFLLEDEIWQRCRPSADDPATWVPGPEDVVLINAAHALYENKAFGLHDIMKIRRAIADGLSWDSVERVARERGWLSGLRFSLAMMGRLEARLFADPAIPTDRFERPLATGSRISEQLDRGSAAPTVMPFFTSWRLVKMLFFQKLAQDRHLPIAAKPALLFLTLARAAKSQLGAEPQNSALITLSGIDGSGKTAQAEALAAALDVCHLRNRVMWARLGATPLMLRLSRLWSARGTAGAGAPPRPDSAVRPALSARDSGLARMVWALLSAADFAGWLLRIRWRLIRGDVVVADRYLCDFDVELALKLPAKRGFRVTVLRLLKLIAPKPRRGFLLDVDADTAMRRATPDGGDFDPRTGTELYREKAESHGLRVLDAIGPFAVTSALVEREALRAYFNRYTMLGNFLFFQNPWQLNRPVRKQEPDRTGTVEPVAMAETPV